MWSVWQTCRTGRRAAGFLGGLLVALLLAAGPAAGQTFTLLSEPLSNGGVAITPAVAITSSGQVYAAWREGDDIYFTRSLSSTSSCTDPGGLKFAPAQKLSQIDTTKILRAEAPSIAVNDDRVFVVWREVKRALTDGVTSIRFVARSLDGSQTLASGQLDYKRFAPLFPVVAADNGGVFADNGGVFVAWHDFDLVAGKSFVAVAQSQDNGVSFTFGDATADRLSSSRPSLASDGSNVHLAWLGSDTLTIKEAGVWYKRFARFGDVASATANRLSKVGAQTPKIAVHGGEVTAVWLEGGNIKRRTAPGGNFNLSVDPDTIYPSTMSLFNLSLSVGVPGPFVAWEEAPDFVSPRSILYILGAASPVTLRLGSSASNPAAPSVGQGGTDRLVATWHETATTTEIRLAHAGGAGGSGGEGSMRAKASTDPAHVNARTMAKGTSRQPNLTVFIEPEGDGWSASAILPGSVKMNGKPALGPNALVGNKLMVKFDRSDLLEDGSYTITGNITGQSCPFSYSGKVPVTK